MALSVPAAALGLRPLPPPLAAAHAAVAWPLCEQPPMRYLPLDAMRRVRASGAAPLPQLATRLTADPEAAVASLGGCDHARVAVGLLLLGLAAADESHALVTPLSWEEGTVFGGPPMLGSAAANCCAGRRRGDCHAGVSSCGGLECRWNRAR